MESKRPLIFITNDDGISSRGLSHLTRIALELGDVVVVAPESAQSGKSSAITVNSPLFINEHPSLDGAKMLSVTGTPVDCVKTGMYAVLDRKPDLILSGINHGSNAAVNNIYSGTMGATMEGCLLGVPSIGYSLLDHSPDADFDPLTYYIREITAKVLAEGLPDGICLNVNFPSHCTPKGVKVVRAAKGRWTEEYATYVTPHPVLLADRKVPQRRARQPGNRRILARRGLRYDRTDTSGPDGDGYDCRDWGNVLKTDGHREAAKIRFKGRNSGSNDADRRPRVCRDAPAEDRPEDLCRNFFSSAKNHGGR